MFAVEHTPIILGKANYKIDELGSCVLYKKLFNTPYIKTKTFPLEDGWTLESIKQTLSNKDELLLPSYIKDRYLARLSQDKNIVVEEDKTRYILETENIQAENTDDIKPVSITECKEQFSNTYKQYKKLEYYRYYDSILILSKLSRIKDSSEYKELKVCSDNNRNICVYSTDSDTAYIYYNSIEPEQLCRFLNQYKKIIWGLYSEYLLPVDTIKAPDNAVKKPLLWVRLKPKAVSIFSKPLSVSSIHPAEAIRKALNYEFRLDKSLYSSLRYFVFDAIRYNDTILTAYEENGLLVLMIYGTKKALVFSNGNDEQSYHRATIVCNELGALFKQPKRVTKEEVLNPEYKGWIEFRYDKSMINLDGKSKRTVRWTLNRVEKDPDLEIRTFDKPEQLNKLVETEITPLYNDVWYKMKARKKREVKGYIDGDLYLDTHSTQYYRNLRPEIKELTPFLFIGLYHKGQLQSFLYSEQDCKTFVTDVQAAGVEKPAIANAREAIAVKMFEYWLDRLKDDRLIISEGAANSIGLKTVKLRQSPSEMYNISKSV